MTLKQNQYKHQLKVHHHRIPTCRRHPTVKPTTGCCPSCLMERLAGIENKSPSSSTTAAATAKLRRTKSYSSRTNLVVSAAAADQPRRRSCDARGHGGTLNDLFYVDDESSGNRKSRVTDWCPELKIDEEEEEREIECFHEQEKTRFEVFDGFDDGGELKTMKEFIDLERVDRNKKNNTGRDLRDIASVFSKKLKKWTMKQKTNKKSENLDSMERSNIERRLISIQSVVGERPGRRSCDTDRRFSIDAAIEEPRVSCDGCLIGKNHQPLTPVIEDVKLTPISNAGTSETDEDVNPGGSAQTRNYYADSSSSRRKSFDRSSPMSQAADLVDKSTSNAKVSPETVGLFHGAKLLVTEKQLRDSNWYSIKEYRSEKFESVNEVDPKGFGSKNKPPRRSLWNVWGLMKNETKYRVVEESKSLKLEGNVIEGSLADSLLKLRKVGNGDASKKLIHSYSVSARNSCDNGLDGGRNSCDGLFHTVNGAENRRNSCDSGLGGRKSCEGLFNSSSVGENRRNSCSSVLGVRNYRDGLFQGISSSKDRPKMCDNDLELRNSRDGWLRNVTGSESRRNPCDNGVRVRNLCDNSLEVGRNSCDGLFHCVNGDESRQNPGISGGENRRNSCDGLFHADNGVEGSRNSCDGEKRKDNSVLERNKSTTRYVSSSNKSDNGLLRFYLSPLRSCKKNKSGKSRFGTMV